MFSLVSCLFFFSSRRRHTRCALVTGVQTCALSICTSAQLDNNFNAPASIAVAAVLYVFRTLVDDDIPLNAGCLKPLEIIVPQGSMLRPNPPAASSEARSVGKECGSKCSTRWEPDH